MLRFFTLLIAIVVIAINPSQQQNDENFGFIDEGPNDEDFSLNLSEENKGTFLYRLYQNRNERTV